jgi:broad-specificity NMP kinase
MTRKLTAIIGRPGTGKTTLMRKFMEGSNWTNTEFAKLVTGHFCHERNLAIIGKYEEGEVFAGTDRLSMAAQPAVLEWLKTTPDGADVIFEGDRLTSQKFFDAVIEMGYDLEIIVLSTTEQILKQRYEERGSDQSETFLNGRATKIANIQGNFDYFLNMREFTNDTPELQSIILTYLKERHN